VALICYIFVLGAASSQEQLAVAAQNAVSTIVQLAEVVKFGAASLGSNNPEAQVSCCYYFTLYRVWQKYLTILQNSCEWNRWHGEFFLERSSSETRSISVAMERWSVEHRAFAMEVYFKNNDSVLTQRIFRQHFSIHQNECP